MAKDCSLIVFITEIKLIKVAFQMKDMRNELTILTIPEEINIPNETGQKSAFWKTKKAKIKF